MKSAAALVTALLTSPADGASFRGAPQLLSLRRQGDVADIGSDKCPCIGFHGVEGDTVGYVDAKHVNFPADLGATCDDWDKDHTPACKGNSPPDWCASQWCYVDPKNCHIDIVPKPATYMPNATFQNMPLYYSYATCGAKDTWAEELPKVGAPGCRCIGIDDAEGKFMVAIGAEKLEFPAELGGECKAWDSGKHPDCAGDGAPDWCRKEWCFVDPCSCSLDVPPKSSDYLGGATFQGKQVYYSYATCGEKDSYSSAEKVEASKTKAEELCSSHDLKDAFGSEKCPCVGFQSTEGETLGVVSGKEIAFPADLGASCSAWDKDYTPTCKADSPPEWCKAKWCYVDPKNCHIDIVPKEAAYQPKATFQNMPLYYSYATCGAKDTWAKELPKVGAPGCRCIGMEGAEGKFMVTIGSAKHEFPAELGGECKAWDSGKHPECGGDSAPDWCGKEWCFVDPCSCSLDVPPKTSDYLGDATFQGKQVYYSYATCGEKDSYSSDEKVKASKAQIADACGEKSKDSGEEDKAEGKADKVTANDGSIKDFKYNATRYEEEWGNEYESGEYPKWRFAKL